MCDAQSHVLSKTNERIALPPRPLKPNPVLCLFIIPRIELREYMQHPPRVSAANSLFCRLRGPVPTLATVYRPAHGHNNTHYPLQQSQCWAAFCRGSRTPACPTLPKPFLIRRVQLMPVGGFVLASVRSSYLLAIYSSIKSIVQFSCCTAVSNSRY